MEAIGLGQPPVLLHFWMHFHHCWVLPKSVTSLTPLGSGVVLARLTIAQAKSERWAQDLAPGQDLAL